MVINVEWKRRGDKIRRFHQSFNTWFAFSNWFDTFSATDKTNERLELIVWVEKD